jgi:membrane associated rhomboid family serine protease
VADATRSEPIFNIPPAVMALTAVLVAIHLGRSLLDVDTDNQVLLCLAFIPDRYVSQGLEWPCGAIAAWTSPLSYMAVHGDTMHLVLNTASLLAFGGLIARRLGADRFLAFTAVCGLTGALSFCLMNWGERAPMIGASGAIAGMMAASLRLMFSVIDQAPEGLAGAVLRRAPHLIRLMSLKAALMDRRVQSATLVWLALNALGAFGLGNPSESGPIAWEAHVGGYLAGLLAIGFLDPAASPSRPNPALPDGPRD